MLTSPKNSVYTEKRHYSKGRRVLHYTTVYFGILSDVLTSQTSDSQTFEHVRSPWVAC